MNDDCPIPEMYVRAQRRFRHAFFMSVASTALAALSPWLIHGEVAWLFITGIWVFTLAMWSQEANFQWVNMRNMASHLEMHAVADRAAALLRELEELKEDATQL